MLHQELLRDAGLRVTPGRLQLLSILEKEPAPLTVYEIERKLKGALNQVTVYRSLAALTKAKIVKRVNLEHDHAHFEIAHGREHHHHAVCRSCGAVEDIEIPHTSKPEQEALKRAKRFAVLDSYALDFFGLCKQCA